MILSLFIHLKCPIKASQRRNRLRTREELFTLMLLHSTQFGNGNAEFIGGWMLIEIGYQLAMLNSKLKYSAQGNTHLTDEFQSPLQDKITIILSYHVHIWAYLPYIGNIT